MRPIAGATKRPQSMLPNASPWHADRCFVGGRCYDMPSFARGGELNASGPST
ncbi:MAG: hypothetical protein IPL41_03065 [Micropruina sp.]|nr:hypothetical protein [Micropruina sp.]